MKELAFAGARDAVEGGTVMNAASMASVRETQNGEKQTSRLSHGLGTSL